MRLQRTLPAPAATLDRDGWARFDVLDDDVPRRRRAKVSA